MAVNRYTGTLTDTNDGSGFASVNVTITGANLTRAYIVPAGSDGQFNPSQISYSFTSSTNVRVRARLGGTGQSCTVYFAVVEEPVSATPGRAT